ncbi:hypothetical protein UMM65_12785 [Aureibaculum sp. 2210JD6-5]|uniref:hypothetical protein n=1 Tax=Aureibaculum sp. 2210JD6-5 TaxID=3103957 RepID=UPI002AAE8E26|nr:hypothetical protein [Aureibaculum sp. 2210JD6-5]MDY7396119.1 hypothetical protein [Aureibaculum sp. 2210JD6-5]
MLKLGGILNIIIAIAHIVGLIWAKKIFEATGVGKQMDELSKIHYSLPYLLTVFVAIVFFIFGLYGLSASNKFKKMPFLKLGIFTIAFIYLFRGIGEQIFNLVNGTTTTSETIQSVIAVIIGLLFLVGGLKKWYLKPKRIL